ncbi:MAG: HNH endonuclease [Phycisphaerales bacterium]
MRTSEKPQRAEDNEHRTAVCQALAKAHAGCPLLRERRGPSDERRQSPPCCANCAYAARVPEGARTLWICANTPRCPGCLACVRECEQCPNFRARRCPVVRGTPPEPPDDSIRFIPLTKGKFAIVDKADYEWLSRYKWCVSATNRPQLYAYRKEKGKNVHMHRLIMQPPADMMVDHADRNGLNNTRANLRICTARQNVQNRVKFRGNSSQYKGVYPCAHGDKWRAAIGVNRRNIHIGIYDHEIEAAKAYDRKALELFGEFARLNFPVEVERGSVDARECRCEGT